MKFFLFMVALFGVWIAGNAFIEWLLNFVSTFAMGVGLLALTLIGGVVAVGKVLK